MNTIIRKEIRENFKLAVIGFFLFALILEENYRTSTGFYARLALKKANWDYDHAHPLLSASVIFATGLFCAIFGALLGWLQIHNESHRDLWAFLIHRPLSRSKIFLAKAIAGIGLYTLGSGLPLAGLIVATGMPGHIAAPFEWVMVLPLLACFLTGIVFYFAGMLTGLRQARWYVSRGLGLGAAFIVCLGMAKTEEFLPALILILVGGAILATAAWGGFMSNGFYAGQPALGRRALVGSSMLGCLVVVGAALALLDSRLPQKEYTWSRYEMTTNGTVYIMTQPAGKPIEITDLNGAPLLDATTGRPVAPTDFYRSLARGSVMIPTEFPDLTNDPSWSRGSYQQSIRYFSLWRQTEDTLWFWNPNGRLWAYDLASRRFLGSLGPDGFAPGSRTGTARFLRPEGSSWNGHYSDWYPARTLFTHHAVYQLDLDHRSSKRFIDVPDHDRIGGAADVSFRPDGWDYTVMVTTNSVSLLTSDGKLVWQTAYAPAYPDYNWIDVIFLEPSNRFALWFHPRDQSNKTNNLPSHFVWLATGQGVLTNLDLPPLVSSLGAWTPAWFGVGMPPVLWPWLYGHWNEAGLLWYESDLLRLPLLLTLVGAVLSVGAGWWLGRRYHFPVASQLKWAVFHLLTGLPGILAFLCVQEWPARESCPNCKKLRLVDREKCEYCGAGFAPPPKNGTEIFEPAGGSSAGSNFPGPISG